MQQTPRPTDWYGHPFAYLASFSQSTYYLFATEVRNTTSLYLNLINVKKENAQLKNENAELKTQLTAMTELKLENERLSQLFQFKQKTKMELLATKVIGRDLNTDHSTILIDRGSQDGVKSGAAVMTIEGAVGYVFRVENTTSRVMLITDRYSVVDGIVQRSRARGLVEGKATDACQLKYVNKSNDVVNGDLVVTSGLDNLFPKGLPIATVELVNKKPYNVNLEVELRPVVNPNKLEELFIVLNANQQDLTPKGSVSVPEQDLNKNKVNNMITNDSPEKTL
jgi:rod shape-determining protein MreC